MIILPNENNWSYDDSIGNWKLVYDENAIVFYEQTDQSIATPKTLFIGTQEECEAEIARLGLTEFSEVSEVSEVL
jgi:hypothetical protein